MSRALEHKRRLALCLVVVAALGASAGLWWNSSRRPDINFLPRLAPAHWIVYPTAPDVLAHRDVELPTLFKTSFDLEKVPAKALLRIAAFHRYALSINGTSIEKPMQAGKNWKQPDVCEVASQLRSGENRIAVTVFNSNGPPALWLFLDTGTLKVSTGENWQASYAGATWCAAALAAQPRVVPVGSALYGGEQPWTSLRTHWPILLVFACLSAAGYWGMRRLDALGACIAGSQRSEVRPPTSDLRLREILPVAVMAGFWVVLFANNLGALPHLFGYDAQGHLSYILYIQENKAVPLASQGWEMFQPPLYYLLSAGVLSLLSLSASQPDGILVLRMLGLVCGVAHFAVVWAALRLLFLENAARQRWGLLLAACLPPGLYLSQYVNNEAMAAALASACVYLCLRLLKQDRVSWRETPEFYPALRPRTRKGRATARPGRLEGRPY